MVKYHTSTNYYGKNVDLKSFRLYQRIINED